MGARPNHVVAMVLAEAAMITGLGGLGGIVLGFALLFAFARSLGFYFESLGVPFGWPAIEVLAGISAAVLAASAALGVAGALYPAWRVRRLEPFALIHGEAPDDSRRPRSRQALGGRRVSPPSTASILPSPRASSSRSSAAPARASRPCSPCWAP